MAPYDRSFLPSARLEFVVVSDTHFIVDAEAYAIEFDSVRQWPARATWALRRVADMGGAFTVHLGDISEEPPGHADHETSRQRADALMADLGLAPHVVAGNMDIGDKPDPTMFTPPVCAVTLDWFHARYGPSWHSFGAGGCHFAVLNSQILNGTLPAAAEQARWLEADLAAHGGERLFLFLHMPPFFVDEDEPDTGFYNSIDEPARSWLTGLCRGHRVEAVFCGHTHFRAFHRLEATRIYVCASTTTSRAGFYEAFSVAPPPEQGRNDPDKLGFCLVRVTDGGHRVYFVRTGGRTTPSNHDDEHDDDRGGDWADLATRTSPDLPASPLGLYLRTPLAHESAGALAWPSVKRQRVRDDHPLLAAVELGARHVRVPVSDLDDPLQSRRLACLREEGVAVTAVWVWSGRLDLPGDLRRLPWLPDTVEVQMPGVVLPPDDLLRALGDLRRHFDGAVSLAPLLPRERVPGRYHPRGRLGFHVDELAALSERLGAAGAAPCRVVGCLDPSLSPWQALRAFDLGDLACIDGLDVALPLPSDDDARDAAVVAGMCAATVHADCRLYLDPFVDLDRTNDLHLGLLDRLGNPRRAFHVARALNTLLAADSGWAAAAEPPPYVLSTSRHRLTVCVTTPGDIDAEGGELVACDLGHATVLRGAQTVGGAPALAALDYPLALLQTRP